MLCLCLKPHILTLQSLLLKHVPGALVDTSLFMESVLGQKESCKLRCDSLSVVPGQGSLPTAELLFLGHNNFEKWGRCVDNRTLSNE